MKHAAICLLLGTVFLSIAPDLWTPENITFIGLIRSELLYPGLHCASHPLLALLSLMWWIGVIILQDVQRVETSACDVIERNEHKPRTGLKCLLLSTSCECKLFPISSPIELKKNSLAVYHLLKSVFICSSKDTMTVKTTIVGTTSWSNM